MDNGKKEIVMDPGLIKIRYRNIGIYFSKFIGIGFAWRSIYYPIEIVTKIPFFNLYIGMGRKK